MKAPRFWYQPEGRAARLLAPFEKLYRAGAVLRRFFAKPYRASIPVICIGNVVAGGSGKTPTALALAELLLKQGHKPVFVTRGYGGSQRGPLRVDAAHHGADDVGDEALLLLRVAPVYIGCDRAATIREAEKEASHIILDDGLQNPHIQPSTALLVMDGAVGLGNGHMIPAGPLREPLAEAMQRVDAVLVVGGDLISSPPLAGLMRQHQVENERGLVNTGASVDQPPPPPPASGVGASMAHNSFIQECNKPILHAHLQPVLPVDFPRQDQFLAFAGIGRPEKFYDLCRKAGLTLAATRDFADHHPFTRSELDDLQNQARALGAHLLTTEKDYVRLHPAIRAHILTFPIRLVFDDKDAIEAFVAGHFHA